MGLMMCFIVLSVIFLIGYFKDLVNYDMDIRNLINGGILVIYMGVKRLG